MSEPRPLGHLVAALSAHADVVSMTQVLTATLADLLPGSLVQVERRRSVADRLAGRPGTPVSLTVRGTDRDLVLAAGRDGTPEAQIVHTVRGVVLSRTAVPITEWITALAAELDRRAASDEAARAALDRLLLG
ncbi:MAG TPA: hypothetical protein VFL65_09570 [Jatrophihabitans sp.]|nr:hypothetical protein [Jatrophihabitans sp.]